MKNKKIIVLFIACLLIFLIVTGNAIGVPNQSNQHNQKNIIYVDCNFNHPNKQSDGSKAFPYTMIQQGIDNATPGYTVFVYNGTYNENVIVNKTINLVGENKDSTIIDGTLLSEPIVNVIADWVNMSGFNIQGSLFGIRLYYSNYSTISDNKASGLTYGIGISLQYSNNNNIIDNDASSFQGYGITLLYSDNNIVTGNNGTGSTEACVLLSGSDYNTITDNFGGFRRGIWLISSSNNTISDNKFINNAYHGIYLESSNYNTITGNNVSNSQLSNIHLSSSNYNIIYNNIFINNWMNAYDDGDNIWNKSKTIGPNIVGGFYLGGNYWNDYIGNDADGDGLGDNPYFISGGSNQDNYPLIKPSILDITVDIKPGDYPNTINPLSKGKIPVAILTTEDFDTSEIDPYSIVLLEASPSMWVMDDVDMDGDIDLLLHFNTQELNFDLLIDEGDEYPYAYLNGETISGDLIQGKDTVRLIYQNTLFKQLLERFIERLIQLFPFLNKILNQIIL